MLKRMKKGLDVQLSAHVKSYELDCCCEDQTCRATFYDSRLLEKFEFLRLVWRYPITINSSFRCQTGNNLVGGVPLSTHQIGLAMDLQCPAEVPFEWFLHECQELFPFVYAHHNSKSLHVDLMERH